MSTFKELKEIFNKIDGMYNDNIPDNLIAEVEDDFCKEVNSFIKSHYPELAPYYQSYYAYDLVCEECKGVFDSEKIFLRTLIDMCEADILDLVNISEEELINYYIKTHINHE